MRKLADFNRESVGEGRAPTANKNKTPHYIALLINLEATTIRSFFCMHLIIESVFLMTNSKSLMLCY